MKNILVFAYSELGHDCLRFLIQHGEHICGVFTHEDLAQEQIWFPSVKKLALTHHLPVWTDEKLSQPDVKKRILDLQPDLMLSFYYRNLIPKDILNIPSLGAFNMHGSLLPRYRGRAPVNWAVLHGETQTGPTLHVMTEKADAGDIVDQLAVPIGPNDTSAIVQTRVNEAAVKILARQIDALKAGTVRRQPQQHTLATKFGRRRAEDGKIDWTKNSSDIHNLIRAVTHPFPGAFTDFYGKKTYIWASRQTLMEAEGLIPGEIQIQNDRLYMACGDGLFLEILSAQIEGEVELEGPKFSQFLMQMRQHITK